MKGKYRAYFKLNLMSIFFLAVSFLSITLAWFAYSGIANTQTDIKVKSWYIEFSKNKEKVSNDIVVSLSDIYPGMDAVTEAIDIKNLGDSDAQVNYTISSVRIFDQELDVSSMDTLKLEDDLSHEYPFHINIHLDKKYVRAKDDVSKLNVSITWPLDSEQDGVDSKWGTDAFNFQKKEEEKARNDSNYQVRSSVKIVLTLKAEQYITSNDSIDMNYNFGDTVLYDVKNNRKCDAVSDTCIKTRIIDVDSKVGDASVALLPDLYKSYSVGTHASYDSILNSAVATWNVSTRALEAKDLVRIISTDILNSYFVREHFSDRIVGNMKYNNRVEMDVNSAKEKSGSYQFLNASFPYLATNKCYWTKDSYDSEFAFAFTKIDDTQSKIYKENVQKSCSIVPVIIVSKANLYS